MVKRKKVIKVFICLMFVVFSLLAITMSVPNMSVFAQTSKHFIGYIDSNSFWHNGNVLIGYANFTITDDFTFDNTYSVYRYNLESDTIDYDNANTLTYNDPVSISCIYSNSLCTDNWLTLGLALVKGNNIYYVESIASYNNRMGYQNGYTDGENSVDTDSYYEDGYNTGYDTGYTNGENSVDTDNYYNNGYNDGAGITECTWEDLDLMNNQDYLDYYNLGLQPNRFELTGTDAEMYARGFADAYYNCGMHYTCCANKNVYYLYGYLDVAYERGENSVDTDSYYNNGYNAGLTAGQTAGYELGYETGYNQGVADVDTDNFYQSGYNAGFNDGAGITECTWEDLDLMNNQDYLNYYNLGLQPNRFELTGTDAEMYARGFADAYYNCGMHYTCCSNKNIYYLYGYLDVAYEKGYVQGTADASGTNVCTWEELNLLQNADYMKEYNAGLEFGIKYEITTSDLQLYAQGYADYAYGCGFHYTCCANKNYYYLRGYLDNFYEDAYENGKIANYYSAFEDGYLAGESYGHKNGYDLGNKDGLNTGYDAGYEDGYNDAVEKETYSIEKFWNKNKLIIITSLAVIIVLATTLVIVKRR